MYTQIHPVTSLLKSTMKQTYYIQSPLRISKALPSEPKVSNTGGNCPCSEAKLPNRIFTNLQSKFGTFGPERKAFNAISYSSDQANAQNQVVQSLDLGKVSQTPRVRKRSFQDLVNSFRDAAGPFWDSNTPCSGAKLSVFGLPEY